MEDLSFHYKEIRDKATEQFTEISEIEDDFSQRFKSI